MADACIGAARPAFIVGLLTILAALGMLLMQSARAQLASSPWPMFRANLRHTGVSPYGTSANPGRLKWNFTIGVAEGDPAIGADGTIYIGSSQYNLYAISTDGSVKWEFGLSGQPESSAAVGANGTIYVGSWDHNLYAVNPDGSLKWYFTTGAPVGSSPAVGADGTIYVGSNDGNLYAIKPEGSLKWKFTTLGLVRSSPAVGTDGTIYVGSHDYNLYAINPDGSLKWKFATDSLVESSPAVGADGTIYVGSDDHNLYAITPYGGRKWAFTTGSYVLSSPAVGADGTIYVGSDDYNFYAINRDGSLKWNFTADDIVYSSPAVGRDGTIYVGSYDGNLYAINPDGSLKWKFTTGGFVDSSPAIGADGTIYVGSEDGNLYAVRKPAVTLSPLGLSFSAQLVDTTGAAQKATLTNGQTTTLHISGVTASGDFRATSACGRSLGSGKSCTISVTFKPTASGERTGTLTVKDSAYNGRQTASLSGIGTWVTASPTSLSFGDQKLGTASAPETVSFTNEGRAPIAIDKISASGDFAKSSTTCGSSIGAARSCSVSVTFKPTKTGACTGTLTVTGSAPFPTVALSGAGT